MSGLFDAYGLLSLAVSPFLVNGFPVFLVSSEITQINGVGYIVSILMYMTNSYSATSIVYIVYM